MSPTPTTDLVTQDLRRVLDGRWHAVREQARRDLDSNHFGPPKGPMTMEDYRERTTSLLHELTAQPFAAMGLTTEQGGTGDHGGSVTAFEMLGHVDLSLFVKAGVQFGLFGGAIANLGTQRHHTAYLPSVIDGSLLGCFAMTETGRGSDVQDLHTTATHDPEADEIVIHSPDPSARKDYIGNAARDGRMAAVFAQLIVGGENHGVHCVLVPIRDEAGQPMPGITISDCGPKMGLAGVDNGRLLFDHVRVPRANLLDRYGSITDEGAYASPIEGDGKRFFTMLGTLVRGRVSVGGGAGAATRNALTLAIRYAVARRQFARPGGGEGVRLIEYRSHQRRLLIPLARTFALALAQNDLVERMHEVQSAVAPDEHAARELEGEAAAMKVANTAHATATIQTCREACGGAGYMWDNRFALLKADTDVFTTFEGDNTVLLQLVAKGLLTNYKDAFESMDTRAMVLFGARQFAGAVIERAIGGSLIQRLISGAPGRDGDAALSDIGGQLALFEDRERHLIETLAARMRTAAGQKSDDETAEPDPFAILNAVQGHMLEAARGHIDRLLLDSFATAIEACDEGPARDLLAQVCDLFAHSTVESNAVWFIEHGRLSAAQSKDLTTKVDALCAELAPHAETLVAAFAIPEGFLVCEMFDDLATFPQ
ncbi:MAG TPA: acyl-CoA dehydrogenase [Phycicoccus sp.]|nr:acyl-CoA dehydrogenase [Phycicoccus sp.]